MAFIKLSFLDIVNFLFFLLSLLTALLLLILIDNKQLTGKEIVFNIKISLAAILLKL